jgi:RES domain-containing protein
MRVWRLAKKQYWTFDGRGAQLYGGRWNSVGKAVIYTSATLSLAALELLVHWSKLTVPKNYVAVPADIPDGLQLAEYHLAMLPVQWRSRQRHRTLERLGDEWVARQQAVALTVPSAVVPSETNVLINPNHPDFQRIRVGTPQPFILDRRLVSFLKGGRR